MKAAQKEWSTAVALSSRLKGTYARGEPLRTRGYLYYDFRGRQVLTKLRVDDLNLGAAGYNSLALRQARCELCKEKEPESRQHFVLRCAALTHIRDRHAGTMSWTRHLSQDDALRVLTLSRPAGATENIDRATAVGALLHDLWKERCTLLGIRMVL